MASMAGRSFFSKNYNFVNNSNIELVQKHFWRHFNVIFHGEEESEHQNSQSCSWIMLLDNQDRKQLHIFGTGVILPISSKEKA